MDYLFGSERLALHLTISRAIYLAISHAIRFAIGHGFRLGLGLRLKDQFGAEDDVPELARHTETLTGILVVMSHVVFSQLFVVSFQTTENKQNSISSAHNA